MLILFGCNYRSAPIEVRERLVFAEREIPEALARLVGRAGIEECMILSTCNRIELLIRTTLPEPDALQAFKQFLEETRAVTAEELNRHGYHFSDRQAVQHLFQVAAGLDSMILGEPQIQGQVKQAFIAARNAGSAGPVLDRLLQQCLATAKRVRRETGISRHAVSVAFAAVHLARQIFGSLEGRRALVLGSGKMGELVARHLIAAGIREVGVASRDYGRAVVSAARFNGQPVRWDEGLAGLADVDVVVSCTGAAGTVLGKREIAHAVRVRRGRPLFLIDIAVPRDIDPAANELDNVYLYDIDGLQEVVDANLEERRLAAAEARKAIAKDVAAFAAWRQARDVAPTIVALRESLMRIGRGEMARFHPRLAELSPDHAKVLEELVRSLIQKVLHRPVVSLKKAAERGDSHVNASIYREIFGLDETNPDPVRDGRDAKRSPETPRDSAARGPHRLLKGGRER